MTVPIVEPVVENDGKQPTEAIVARSSTRALLEAAAIKLQPMIVSGSIDDTTIDIEPKAVSLDDRVDYRDLVIEELVTSEARLIERVIEMTIQRDSYAVLARHAISYGHDLTVERDLLREQHRRLLDEFRHLRARVMSRDLRPGAAA